MYVYAKLYGICMVHVMYLLFQLLESVLNASVVYIFVTCSRFWANHVYYFKINIACADLLVGIQAILGFVQINIFGDSKLTPKWIWISYPG